MKIKFASRKQQEEFSIESVLFRKHSQAQAKCIKRRMKAFKDAKNLHYFWPPKKKPERCHELKGNKKGIFSVDLDNQNRLLFKPTDDIVETAKDSSGHYDWSLITEIVILGVEDTHG